MSSKADAEDAKLTRLNITTEETMLGKKGGAINGQWAFLQFDSPVFCAADSTLIGSRLDLEEPGACRIAFHGKVDTALGPSDVLGIAAVNDGANTFSAGDTSKTQAKGSDGTKGNQGGTGINHPVREKLRIYKTKERIGRVVRVAAGVGLSLSLSSSISPPPSLSLPPPPPPTPTHTHTHPLSIYIYLNQKLLLEFSKRTINVSS